MGSPKAHRPPRSEKTSVRAGPSFDFATTSQPLYCEPCEKASLGAYSFNDPFYNSYNSPPLYPSTWITLYSPSPIWAPFAGMNPDPNSFHPSSLRLPVPYAPLQSPDYHDHGSESSSLSDESVPPLNPSHDAHYPEPYVSERGDESLLPPVPPSTPISVCTFDRSPATLTTSPLPAYAPVDPSSRVADTPKRRSSSRHDEPKVSYYRTKLCKFYHTTGQCVKGNRCNFIHDGPALHNAEMPRAQALPRLASENSSKRKVETARSRTKCDGRAGAPSSTEEDVKNFYPVTWRVIGGGVMMGGQRDVCRAFIAGECVEGDDCRFAHLGSGEDLVSSSTPQDYPTEARATLNSPTPFFPVFDCLSPVSPMCPNPFAYSASQFPSSPPLLDLPRPQLRRGSRRYLKKLSIAPQAHLPNVTVDYSPHRVLDGNTLIEISASEEPDSHCSGAEAEPADNASNAADGGLLAVRTIMRPVSTPPTPSAARTMKTRRLFSAEMP